MGARSMKLVQVSLDIIPSFSCVNHTTQLGVISKFGEGAVDPFVYVIDEDIKQCWSQYGPLRDTAGHWDCDPLNSTLWVQPSNPLLSI